MKRSSNIASKTIGLLILFVAVIFVCADMPASAQNTNSSTTGGDTMMQSNSNTGSMRRGMGRRRARRRRARRRARRNANASTPMVEVPADATTTGDTSTPDATTNTNMASDTQGGSMPGMGTFGDVADLSGTYTGTINYADGGMTGDATLTITPNTFTITAGSATQEGTLSARSWPGYTALSMRFGTSLPATIVSTRAWHKGKSLRIQSVPGESHKFTFNGRSQ